MAGPVHFFWKFNVLWVRADGGRVSAMRARLMMKLIGLAVMLALTVVASHSCSPSPASSTLNPNTVLHNGVAGLCANQAATDAAGAGDTPSTSLQVPASDSGLAAMAGVSPGALSCPTATVPPGP